MLTTLNINHIQMGVEAFKEYLDYLGIKVISYKQHRDSENIQQLGSLTSHYSIPRSITTYIECSCSKSEYEYLSKYAYLQSTRSNPIVNRDALYGGYFQPDGSPIETVFQEEIQYIFQIAIRVGSLEELDSFILQFKAHTEPLRYKRFNEAMDLQITEELSKE